MANPRFNKQVAQPRVARKGGGMGGRVKKMGGCMSKLNPGLRKFMMAKKKAK